MYMEKVEKAESIWSKTVSIPEREFLRGENHAEVAVIGAGMAGLLTAYFLQKRGKKVIVLEADRIGSGQTKNTTAKITSQHGLIYTSLKKKYGKEKACLYAKAQEEAIESYQQLIEEEGFSCHFERLPAFLYSIAEEKKLKREAETAKELGLPASFVTETELPFSVKGTVVFENQAQFHPLEFVKQLAEKLTIYEQTEVLRVKGRHLETNHGNLYADIVVFASHFPFRNIPGFYFARQHQERSYVLALSGIPRWEGMYYSEEKDGLSFRWYEDILLLGGGGHRTGVMPGKKWSQTAAAEGTEEKKQPQKAQHRAVQPKYGYSKLISQAKKLFPEARAKAYWSAQDCITQDGLPFIGTYSVFRPDWYVASGFKKWGMTGSMVSAKVLCDLICGEKNPYAKLFSPRRFPFHSSIKNLGEDLRYSVKGLVKGHFHWPLRTGNAPEKGEARILRVGLKRYGVYRDLSGVLHRVSVKCPHLGCELAWNPEDLTWDCPCHGSRFDYDGNLIDNPAQTEI